MKIRKYRGYIYYIEKIGCSGDWNVGVIGKDKYFESHAKKLAIANAKSWIDESITNGTIDGVECSMFSYMEMP